MVKLEEIYELTKDLLRSVEDLKTEIKLLKENASKLETTVMPKLMEIENIKKRIDEIENEIREKQQEFDDMKTELKLLKESLSKPETTASKLIETENKTNEIENESGEKS